MSEEKLVLESVSKSFGDGENAVVVLNNLSLRVKAGELVAIVGPSGSGKSTFLSIAGALLSPSGGRVMIDGDEINNMSSAQMNSIRLKKIGFIFQSANLIPYLTVRDQLLLVTELEGNRDKEAKKRADDLLEKLGLAHRKHHYPESLSGGERQRVAIARAWMNNPEIIFADEPTASLDSERGRAVVQMLADEVKLRGKSAVMVTHDQRMLDLCDRVVWMEDGKLAESNNVQV
ncbi:ABC transporter ATP-binding protein [Priestia megaterium]|jgi:putative ABC transport system ATP-binding protein|uniref:Putative hemin import ATP-binding protein HrtA n=2 Tax=Priestia megaterium TaxID=1404 RepID=A0A6M6DPI5_PRIMG|nr:ABC transporter ATP-binding protein [Priestia megaterium]AJI21880.1 ABC transporter family protein [Priestia megaterium NBRC 15308 = ATCC 14581]KFN05521.1 ABC transporter family protein [Priestia megaterium]KGJ77366.1 hemin ABC transporter ATP-binding protein [Priestia megaterium NBRC 15308 = ATCC 14581]KLV31430.1 hemin ABC transporter ATP-binding protein [Priestia megaterium]MCE4088495.1 ABC transporter ATP-binding protein [Priestia megaterium]